MSWLRKRREQVQKLMATAVMDEAAQDAGKAAWATKHEAQLNFQEKGSGANNSGAV